MDGVGFLFLHLERRGDTIGCICVTVETGSYWGVLVLCSQTKSMRFVRRGAGGAGALGRRCGEVFGILQTNTLQVVTIFYDPVVSVQLRV